MPFLIFLVLVIGLNIWSEHGLLPAIIVVIPCLGFLIYLNHQYNKPCESVVAVVPVGSVKHMNFQARKGGGEFVFDITLVSKDGRNDDFLERIGDEIHWRGVIHSLENPNGCTLRDCLMLTYELSRSVDEMNMNLLGGKTKGEVSAVIKVLPAGL